MPECVQDNNSLLIEANSNAMPNAFDILLSKSKESNSNSISTESLPAIVWKKKDCYPNFLES